MKLEIINQKSVISFIFSFLISSSVYAENLNSAFSCPLSSFPEITGEINFSTKPWHKEKLDYEIYWGFINVGQSYLYSDRIVLAGTRPAYHFISEARSSSFIDNFYQVRDLNEAWMDSETLYSYGYYKNIKEGKYIYAEWVLYDISSSSFTAQRKNKDGEITESSGLIPGPVNDVLTSLYAVRTKNLDEGSEFSMPVNTKKNWTLIVKVHKREKIKTPAGKVRCVLIEPRILEEGIFISKKNAKLYVWLTDDEAKIPVMIKAEIFIGSVTAKLAKRSFQ
ncbi:MAG: DUF3108 domain-containing protein [Elusimicrobia bacterium]|nr:DUF3108 domain-containing protein [Elusimicrobiota bacterium]